MKTPLTPSSLAELAEAVRSAPRVLAVGNGTKPRLSAVEAVKISTRQLRSIVEYDPGEFTFTALAGTPLSEISAVLAERGQCLPFDPLLVDAGATLGGTMAAGLSGPGRFRYGGVRDFILGVRLVDGAGRVLRLGGKVVKNAAGFDVPKFLVGSLGRFGVIGEVTFKVFPRPVSSITLRLRATSPEDAVRILTEAARSHLEFDALDLEPGSNDVLARLAGPPEALDLLSAESLSGWSGERLDEATAVAMWRRLREFSWAAPGQALAKVPLTPTDLPALRALLAELPGAQAHISAGGNVAFVACANGAAVSAELAERGWSGLTLRGDGPLWSGRRAEFAVFRAVKQALDPEQRFPNLDD
jgi:glycolate oxidase FAD binding subunit